MQWMTATMLSSTMKVSVWKTFFFSFFGEHRNNSYAQFIKWICAENSRRTFLEWAGASVNETIFMQDWKFIQLEKSVDAVKTVKWCSVFVDVLISIFGLAHHFVCTSKYTKYLNLFRGTSETYTKYFTQGITL